MSLSLVFSSRILSILRRSRSASRAILVGPSDVVNNEKSNSFSNIILLSVLTRKTAIYRSLGTNSRTVMLTTALSRVIPYAL